MQSSFQLYFITGQWDYNLNISLNGLDFQEKDGLSWLVDISFGEQDIILRTLGKHSPLQNTNNSTVYFTFTGASENFRHCFQVALSVWTLPLLPAECKSLPVWNVDGAKIQNRLRKLRKYRQAGHLLSLQYFLQVRNCKLL